jgi:malate permease and related proteins
MIVVPVLYTLLQLVVPAALGFTAGRRGSFSESFYRELSRMVVHIAFPLYFFSRIASTDPAAVREAILFPPAAVLIILSSLLFSGIIFHFLPGTLQERRTGIALASFGNSGMIPLTITELLPLSMPLFAERIGAGEASLFVGAYLLAEVPIIWSLGNFLVTGKGRVPKLNEIITPPLIGVVAGLFVVVSGLQQLLFAPQYPFYYVMQSFAGFGSITFILILFILGSMVGRMNISFSRVRGLLPQTLSVASVRFLLLPGLFFLGISYLETLFQLSLAVKWILFLQMSTPPATNLSLMASKAGQNEEHVTFSILVNYILYLFVLPVYIILFFRLF